MRWSIKRAFSLVAFLSIFVFSGSALASFATATAEFDWSGFTYTVSSGSISWSEPSKYTGTWASASNSVPENSFISSGGADWGAYSSTATVTQATATGSADSKLTSTSNAGPTGLLLPDSDASAYRGGTFAYAGTGGLVTFSIPYTLSYDLTASPGGTAYGYSYASMVLTRSTPGQNSEYKWISDLAYDNQYLTKSISGTASLVPLFFTLGQTGDISFSTYSGASASAVPIPGAIWLLGTGLLGVVGIRRRRLNARL